VRAAFSVSFALHAVAIVVAYVGLPHLFSTPEYIDTPIVVELVTIAEETRAQKAVPKEKPKAKPKAPPKVKPEHKPKAEPKPEPKPVKVAAVEPEAAPPPPPPTPKPQPKVKPKLEPKPVAKPKVKPKKPEPKKPVKTAAKPRWKPKAPPKPKKVVVKKPKPKKKKFDPTRIAALLDKTKRDKAPVENKKPDDKQPPPKTVAVVSRSAAVSSSAPMTISEVDAVRYKIEKCWIVPAGARDAENLAVRIRIFLNPDGTIRGAPEIVESARMNQAGQQFFKIAAESARRAVLKCQPYDMLPQKKYERWREIELTFNPKEMLGG